MNTITAEQKKMLISVAISTLSDEFFRQYGRHSVLDELPEFVNTFGANTDTILGLIDKKNAELPWPLSTQIKSYPNFLLDLSRNLELERIPRSLRPDRSVT